MSQQLNQETELRRSSRTTNSNRKNYSDYFSDDDVLTEHDNDDDIEEEDLEEEEEYEDASNEEYIQEEVSDDSSDKEVSNEASVKDINTKFACGLCSNTLSDPYIIPACCHRFCCTCIQESLKAGIGPCPTCRDHSVSFQSLRRDELMGRLLTRYHMLQEKIQKKKIDEGEHKIQKKRSLESTATDETVQGEADDKNTATSSGTRKRRKREISSNENSSKTSSSDPKPTKESAQAKSSSSKKVSKSPKNKKRKAKSSNDILTFNERLRCLREFKKKYGHVNVPKNCRKLSCHEGLGRWCSTMRLIKAGNYKQFTNPEFKLTKKRMKVLEDMGFRWSSTKTFEEHFQELQAFKERHGHCLVPKDHKENKTLGNWCARLRLMKAGTQPNTGSSQLTPKRIKRLEDLGFRWRLKSLPLKRIDMKKVDFVDQAYQENNIEVMKKKVDSTAANESKTLKVEPVVRKKKHPASTRKDPKKESIEVGLDSTEKEDDIFEKLQRSGKVPRFEECLRLLKKYKEEHGHCNVPKSYREKGLGDFSHYVRLVHAGIIEEGKHPELKLTKERMEKLNKLQFRWRFQHSFDEYFSLLQSFKAKTGHCNVTKSDKFSLEYPGLATWVSRIRGIREGRREQRKRAKLQLTEERIKQLDKIGFRWNATRTWDEYMDDLRDFKAKHGHCDVPFLYSENKSLGYWVGKLRSMRAGTRTYKKKGSGFKESPHKLTEERIAQLDKMGFKWRIRG